MNTEQLNSIFSTHLGVEDLRLFLNTEWSSGNEGHRQILRSAIDRYFEEQTARGLNARWSVTDLATLPDVEGHALSISHCKRAGGFIVTARCKYVGLDIEINRRLQGVKLGLVSVDEQELSEAPSAVAFWTAKEAAFKCLRGPGQPRGLKDIRVGSWKTIDSGIHRFDVLEIDRTMACDTTGLVIDDGEMSYAVCVRRGQE